MKKFITLIGISSVLALTLAGCGNAQPAASSSAAASAEASAQESSVQESSVQESSEAQVGMANPWSDVASAEEAAQTAGLGGFVIPLGSEISLGALDPEHTTFRAMESLAQANVEFPAVSMTIRKGAASVADDEVGITGDYRDCSLTWTQDIDGIEVKCSGNREDASMITTWTNGGAYYSITVEGLGGDTDYGLSADDLSVLVPAIM